MSEGPFRLLTQTDNAERPVTLRDLSMQIGAVGAELSSTKQMVHLHREETAHCRAEVADLRKHLLTDVGPRVTQVEASGRKTLPPGVKKGALYTVLVTAYPLLEALVPVIRSALGQ